MTQEKPSVAYELNEGDRYLSEDTDIPVLQEKVQDTVDLEFTPGKTHSNPSIEASNTENSYMGNGTDGKDTTEWDTEQFESLEANEEQDEEIHTLSLQEAIFDDEQSHNIATLEAIVFDGEDPNAPAPKPARGTDTPKEKQVANADIAEHPQPTVTLTPVPAPTSSLAKPLPQKSENPFLPQHILDRLNQGKRNLVEEIAQSGAALDASTAILRARADRLHKPSFSDQSNNVITNSYTRDKSTYKKQQLVDELVDEYLPLLASELRRRLRKILDE